MLYYELDIQPGLRPPTSPHAFPTTRYSFAIAGSFGIPLQARRAQQEILLLRSSVQSQLSLPCRSTWSSPRPQLVRQLRLLSLHMSSSGKSLWQVGPRVWRQMWKRSQMDSHPAVR